MRPFSFIKEDIFTMSTLKKITTLFLAFAMSLSLTGCYNKDLTWAAKDGDNTAAIGIYLYYLYVAYDNAADMVDSDTEVLKATIDGESAETWIRDKAINYLQSYLWVCDKISEYNLDLTSDEKTSAQSTTSYLMNYMSGFDSLGISEDSFNKAYSEYNIMFKKLFDYYYGEGGEFAIDKDELKESFVDGKYSFEYMYGSLTTTDDDGNTSDISDEDKQALYSDFETYKKKVESGYQTLDYCSQEYQVEINADSAPYVSVDSTDFVGEAYPNELVEAVKEMDDNTLKLFEADGKLVLLQKNDINTAFDTAYSSSSDRLSMMLDLKSDEFNSYILEQAAAEKSDIEINDAAIKSCKLKSLVTDSNKNGSSSEASAEESSESSEESSKAE